MRIILNCVNYLLLSVQILYYYIITSRHDNVHDNYQQIIKRESLRSSLTTISSTLAFPSKFLIEKEKL